MTYRDLRNALTEFDLPPRVSWRQLKERHRQLVKRYHPDNGDATDPDRIRRINDAYRVLREYCTDYRFDFSHQEFLEQCPEERLREQFSEDSLWGGGS
ncbi:MAG: molecular chaperone DnaJ [Desulfuromonas sp.]|nr:MAG: molecular chaperone DnaJ [Desulfuromonas sp.]